MKRRVINYFHTKTSKIEIIYCKDSQISYPEHNHISIYTIGLVLDGSIEVRRKNENVVFNTGEVFVILPYEPHAIISSGRYYSTISICLDKSLVLENGIECFIHMLRQTISSLASIDIITLEQLEVLINTIVKLHTYDTDVLFNSDKAITTIRDLLETMPESETKLEQLLKNNYISKYHFIRKFKRHIGLTPHQFQIQNRVRKSQRLIVKGNSMTDVALVTGFYDQSHFNKCFKKIVGITPSEYLRAYKSM